MALATQSHLEQWLQINVTNEPDAAVTMLLENATGLINGHIQRVLELSSYSESHDPPPGPDLHLRQWPIDETANAVTVTDNGTALVKDTDFRIYESSGKLVRISGSGRPRNWVARNPQAITVTYDAGYDMTTDPLIEPEAVIARDTCTRIVARVFQAAAAYANAPVGASGLKSLSLEGSDSITYATSVSGVGGVTAAAIQLTDSDKAVLDPLMRRVLISG